MNAVGREIDRRQAKLAPLRKLFADGQWHDMHQLAAVAGMRYGARIFELRRGDDGEPPLDIEKRQVRPGFWEYRARPRVAQEDGQVLMFPGVR
jgi:hypothetical protein